MGAGSARFSATRILKLKRETIRGLEEVEFCSGLMSLLHTQDYPKYVSQPSMAKNYLFHLQFEACCEFNVWIYAVDLTIRIKLFFSLTFFQKIFILPIFSTKVFISKKKPPLPQYSSGGPLNPFRAVSLYQWIPTLSMRHILQNYLHKYWN